MKYESHWENVNHIGESQKIKKDNYRTFFKLGKQ